MRLQRFPCPYDKTVSRPQDRKTANKSLYPFTIRPIVQSVTVSMSIYSLFPSLSLSQTFSVNTPKPAAKKNHSKKMRLFPD